MNVLHRDRGSRHRTRGPATPINRLVTLAAALTLLAGVTTVLSPTASADSAPADPPTTGSISGTVTFSDDSEVDQVCALAYPASSSYDWTIAGGACANEDGVYTITDLPFGRYVLRFMDRPPATDDTPNHDIPQWLGGTTYFDADTFIVTSSAPEKAGVNVTMLKGGTITLTQAGDGGDSTGSGSPDSLTFTAYPVAQQPGTEKYQQTSAGGVVYSDDGSNWTPEYSTGFDANETAPATLPGGLPAGQYYVVDQFGTEYGPITVTAGADTRFSPTSQSPAALQLFGITGQINDSDTVDSKDVTVSIYRSDTQAFVASTTTSDVSVMTTDAGYSTWTARIPTGTYIVKYTRYFYASTDEPAIRSAWLGATDEQSTEGTADTATIVYKASDAARIVIGDTGTEPVDAGAVTLSLGGTISGTILADIPGLYVSACSTDPQSENECMGVITADDGSFSITGLTPNGTYTVMTDGGTGTGLVPQRVQDVRASAEDAEGTPLEIEMENGPIIAGTVTDAETGLPITGIGVWPNPIWNENQDLNFFLSSSAEIDEDGSYTTQGLEPGVYAFGIGNENGRYQCGWWSTEHGTVTDQDAATAITVGTENVTGQDIRLGVRTGSSCDAFPYSDDNGGDAGENGDNGGNTGASTGGSDGSTDSGTPTTPVTSEPVVKSVPVGGTASSTSATKPNATTPVIAKVTSPVAGDVKFTPKSGPVAPPKDSAGAYTMLGRSFVIEAPTTTPDKPLSLDFAIDDSIMPTGLAASDVIVFRDGVAVPDCNVPNATKADPDPCIVGRSSVKDMKSIRVLSSHASTWTFGVESTPRVAGSNRYATAAALATEFGAANAIVVANGTDAKDGVDALAANYLAGRVNAPILLAQTSRVETETLTAVKAVLKGAVNPTIYVMGGADSISDAVANQIKAAAASVASGTVTVRRIGGADRYATSVLAVTATGSVANSLKLSASGKASTTAILTSGEVNADALAAGALSYAWGIPVLLTQAGQLLKPVQDAIAAQKITQLIVLGGTDRVSQAVLDQAKAAGVTSIKRIAGVDRFDTSAQLYAFAMGTLLNGSGIHYGADGSAIYLANGITGFPDALAVGPLAGASGSVLLTVRPNKLGDPAAKFIKAHSDTLDAVKGLGSASTIAASVLTQASGLL